MEARKIALLSLALYLPSLFFQGLAAIEANPYGFDGYRGYLCLFVGWTTAVSGWKYFLPWTANLFYFPALLVAGLHDRPPRWIAFLAGAGAAVAMTSLRIDSALVNEAGHRAAVRLGLGGWLWLSALITLAVGAAIWITPDLKPEVMP